MKKGMKSQQANHTGIFSITLVLQQMLLLLQRAKLKEMEAGGINTKTSKSHAYLA